MSTELHTYVELARRDGRPLPAVPLQTITALALLAMLLGPVLRGWRCQVVPGHRRPAAHRRPALLQEDRMTNTTQLDPTSHKARRRQR